MEGEMTREQIESVLRSELMGRIGCHAEGRTYVLPISYAYDGEFVYAHSSEGLKLRTMRANPAVCFEVEQVDDLVNWRTVLAWGTFEELSDADEDLARRRIHERFAPYVTSDTLDPATPRTAEYAGDRRALRSIFYRIKLGEKTGRYERR